MYSDLTNGPHSSVGSIAKVIPFEKQFKCASTHHQPNHSNSILLILLNISFLAHSFFTNTSNSLQTLLASCKHCLETFCSKLQSCKWVQRSAMLLFCVTMASVLRTNLLAMLSGCSGFELEPGVLFPWKPVKKTYCSVDVMLIQAVAFVFYTLLKFVFKRPRFLAFIETELEHIAYQHILVHSYNVLVKLHHSSRLATEVWKWDFSVVSFGVHRCGVVLMFER